MTADRYHRTYKAGEWVFREGDPGDCAFVVERGQLEVRREEQGEWKILARLKPGEVVGEMALIDHRPRTASALALTDLQLRVVTHQFLDDKLEETDPLLRFLLRTVLDRYRAALGGAARPASTEADADRQLALTRVQLEQDLEQALERKEFVLHFQPIVRLEDLATAGFEALIRWQSPTRGLVPPGEFIPTAEESHLIVEMGRWAVETACATLSRMKAKRSADGCTPLFMTVNLSGRHLVETKVLEEMQAAVVAAGITPAELKLEITESLLMDNLEKATAVLEQFRAAGLQLALDDFGTGYSSLSYLDRFPVDTLKVDRSFIIRMLESQNSQKILRSIGGLAHALGMKLVAEGVETVDQAEHLFSMNFEYAQGFLFSRAVPEAEAMGMISRTWTPAVAAPASPAVA